MTQRGAGGSARPHPVYLRGTHDERTADVITQAIAARLEAVDARVRCQDLYAGSGTAFYERLVGPDRVEIREVLALARETGGPILDIGAGTGRLTLPLVRSGHRVTALDRSEDMLAHLRCAMPGDARVECVIADMRDFSIGRRYALAVIGATSITLLDRAGRAALYARVREHLSPRGVFALTVADGASAQSLATPVDEEISVPGPDGCEPYLFSQQMEDAGAVRVVNWVRRADLVAGGDVVVLTSRLQVFDPRDLARELVGAGFAEPVVAPVRAQPGVDIVMLTTSQAGSSEMRADDAAN